MPVMNFHEWLNTAYYLLLRLANVVNNSIWDDPAYLALLFT
jgi:hypothetical protein